MSQTMWYYWCVIQDMLWAMCEPGDYWYNPPTREPIDRSF